MTLPRPILEAGWAFHRLLHRVTGGRLSTAPPSEGGVGTLFLHSTGRKTGKARRNGLFYIEDGRSLVVVASNAGDHANPRWWLNLQAAPDATVEIGKQRIPVRARAATPEEAERLWPRLDAAYPAFVTYRAQVLRTIAIVILEPSSPEAEPDRVPLVAQVEDGDGDEQDAGRDLDRPMMSDDPPNDGLAPGGRDQ
jgi:deazaflavin-dependent oxidoreductase (nitroreductase family)